MLVVGTAGGDSIFAFEEGNPSIRPYAAYLAGLPGPGRDSVARAARLEAA
jgi:hypothetical protein